AVEEAGTEAALEVLADRSRVDPHGLRLRIEHGLVRREQVFDALSLEQLAIALEGARVALEVLARQELQAIHENGHRDARRVLACDSSELQMSLVEIAHGRDKGHRARNRPPEARNVAQD